MDELLELYKAQFGRLPSCVKEIPGAVSTRRYFRIEDGNETFIGTYSPDHRETRAFITYARHFFSKGISVPEVIAQSEDEEYYIQSDLGPQRFHELVISRPEEKLTEELISLYKKSLDELIRIQIEGHKQLDYSVAVPRPEFDFQSIYWDLNHFKYYFLKPSGLPFDEDLLETSFQEFAGLVAGFQNEYFMFRDFQTRNIMITNGKPYFIDFQGGRKGPLQYDLASLLLESRAALMQDDQEQLFSYYLQSLGKIIEIDESEFRKEYYTLALLRILQVLGTYGLRGLMEKKAVFIQSIPHGLRNLQFILQKTDPSHISSTLDEILTSLAASGEQYASLPPDFEGLTISIFSFSYRKALPDDISGNGGGFVYDCRYLPNPGRFEKYRSLTGFDDEVQEFLNNEIQVSKFIDSIKSQVQNVVDTYTERKFKNLMLSFGCTGGQHRSVYVASRIAEWSRKMPDVRVIEKHREIGVFR